MRDSIVNEIKAYALSNDDINAILEPDTVVFPYPKFNKMSHIDEAFDSLGRCVFLFLTTSKTSGHWLCMFKKGNSIYYFDSYGDPPDAQREWLSQDELDALDESEPRLTQLLSASGYKVFYSTFKYQSDKRDINSCGRWVVARLICKDMTDLQFYINIKAIMKKNGITNLDTFVSFFTADILGK